MLGLKEYKFVVYFLLRSIDGFSSFSGAFYGSAFIISHLGSLFYYIFYTDSSILQHEYLF